mgnify:FL=1
MLLVLMLKMMKKVIYVKSLTYNKIARNGTN